MKKGWMIIAAVALGATAFAAGSAAPVPVVRSLRQTEVLLHAGLIGIADGEAVDNFVSLEARWHRDWHRLRPWGGVTLVDSGSWFAGAGAIYDIPLSRHARLALGSGPFYYTAEENDDDLGFRLEFYSFAELSWEWSRERRLGLRVGHLSNAGLGRRNPGTETLSLLVSLPLGHVLADVR
jgi:lipid A 3-O-deacylase